jgi:glyoxylase-like metal-dependent hydrolase (beta-lactamase superfamily II)
VAYFHRPSKLVAVGDILFPGSIGATSTPYGDRRQLIHSIRERLFPLGDHVRFIPGHGRTSTIGMEREINPFVADYLHL